MTMKKVIETSRSLLRADAKNPGGRNIRIGNVSLWTVGSGVVIVCECRHNYPHYAGSDLRQIAAAASRIASIR